MDEGREQGKKKDERSEQEDKGGGDHKQRMRLLGRGLSRLCLCCPNGW